MCGPPSARRSTGLAPFPCCHPSRSGGRRYRPNELAGLALYQLDRVETPAAAGFAAGPSGRSRSFSAASATPRFSPLQIPQFPPPPATTCVEGTLLHILWSAFMCCVWGIQKLSLKPVDPHGFPMVARAGASPLLIRHSGIRH